MKNNRLGICLFLLPVIVLFALIYGWSIVVLISTSFTDWHLLSPLKFNGLTNYLNMFKDLDFIKAFTNTLIWTFIQAIVHVSIGVTMALILAKKEFYWKFARTAYMIPNIISAAALGMVYLFVFNPKFGALNATIRLFGVKDFTKNWFFDYSTSFFTVTMTWLPFAALITILCLAEIATIPESIFESAQIDGANELQKNFFIVLPLLKNIIGTCVIVAATSMLKNFDLIFMTTNGGPGNNTLNLPLYIYKTSMLDNNFGYANAIGTVLILLGVIIIVVTSKVFKMGKSDL